MQTDGRIARAITGIAATVALLVAVLLPAGYYGMGRQYTSATLVTEAEINARLVTQIINANPTHWRFEQSRLEALLSRRAATGEQEIRRIIDSDGRQIAHSGDALLPPLITQRAPVYDAGRAMGWIEVVRSQRPLLIETALVALLACSLALAVFVSLRVLPLRALRAATRALTREKEHALAAQRIAEQAMRAKSEFLATMSHELRTRMNGVIGMIEVLAHSDVPERKADAVRTIGESAHSLLGIIDDILDFSKIEAGHLALERTPVVLADIVEGVCDVEDAPDDTLPALDCVPLRQRGLLRAVAQAAGRMPPEHVGEQFVRKPAARTSVAAARTQDRLILVAEDDRTNQKVILGQLELLGHAAEVAGDGTQALRLWRTGRFVLLLADLHMPKMDGYALTAAIRRDEKYTGRRRMPIVALTANALANEAKGTLALGMDAYLTKPVRLEVLKDTLDHFLPSAATSAVDIRVLGKVVGDDADTLRDFLTEYRASAQDQVAALRDAVAAGDGHGVNAIAHRLKSSSRSIGALALGELCAELENASHAGDAPTLGPGLMRFENEFAAVEACIDGQLTGPLSRVREGSLAK